MKNNFFRIVILFSIFITNYTFSQSEEAQRWLVDDPAWYASVKGESTGNTVRIDITCSGESAADIKKEAVKSALFMLIFKGFEPGPNGEPSIEKLTSDAGLYSAKKSEFDNYLNDPQQGPMLAQAMINPSNPPSEIKVEKKKLQKATYTVEISLENLRSDLEKRKLITTSNQSSTGYIPNVVILPSDTWMKNNRFHSTKENQGAKVDLYDYNNALDNPDMKKALAEIKSKFEKNFKIISYKDKVAEINKEVAKNNALSVAKQQSELDIYAKVLAADIWIKIDIDNKKVDGGQTNQKFIQIEAYNPFTGNAAFTGRQIEKQSTGDNDWEITKNSIREACDEIKPRFTEFFKKREEEGIEGRISCTISESAGDINFTSTFPFKGKEVLLSKLIESSIKKVSQKTANNVDRMNPDGEQTPTLLNYKDCYIPPFIEEEEIDLEADENAPAKKVLSSNNFGKVAEKVIVDLKTKFGILATYQLKGLGKVEIIITGKQ